MTHYPPPAPPTPQPPPSKPPFYKRWWFWAAAVIVVIGIASGGAASGNNDNDKDASTPPPAAVTGPLGQSETPNETEPADDSTSEATAPTLTTRLSEKGDGIRDTKSFTVDADEWEIKYSFNCANFGQAGNFQIYLYKSGDNELVDIAANELSEKGKATSTRHGAGKYYMKINSACTWRVRVVG